MSDGAPVPPAMPDAAVPERGRPGLSLATRTGLLAAGVAALAVVLSALVAWPLVRQAAVAQAQLTLSQQADVVAGLLSDRTPGDVTEGELRDLAQSLQEQGINAFVVRGPATPPAPVTAADVDAVIRGRSMSEARETDSGVTFIEGRSLRRGSAVFLVQQAQVATAATAELLERMLIALALGLVLAALVGWLAARRVTRSLRDAAQAAERIRAGERALRLEPEGPAEVADIADALNRLSSALATSENRQRAFLMSVSHELRTPLTAVKGYGEALRDGVIPHEDVPRTGAIVLGEADRLERLVSDLLDLARAGAVDHRLSPVEVDLRQFALDAGEVWSHRCEREGVRFVLEAPPAPLLAVTDPLRLRQIVDNLAENALRVTPAGAPIVLALRSGEPMAPGSAVVEIRDGGPGLTEEDLPVAFVPEELHSRYRGVRQVGTGLGLALVGELAGRLGGTAEAGHAAEGGARFTVTIPLAGP